MTVKYEVVTNTGFDQKIAAAILAGNPPDVLRPIGFKREWARQGLLEPVEDYFTADDKQDFYGYAMEVGKVGSHYYLFPWNNSNNGMGSTFLINPAIFKECGVSIPPLPERGWTVDEFMQIAQKLTFDRDGDGKTDVYALSFPAKELLVMMGWMHVFGARLFNADQTEVVLNSPEGVRALQFVVDAIYKYNIAPEGAAGMGIYDSINMFHQGKTAMGYGGPYEIGRIDRYVKEGQLKEAFQYISPSILIYRRLGPLHTTRAAVSLCFEQRDAEKKKVIMDFAFPDEQRQYGAAQVVALCHRPQVGEQRPLGINIRERDRRVHACAGLRHPVFRYRHHDRPNRQALAGHVRGGLGSDEDSQASAGRFRS